MVYISILGKHVKKKKTRRADAYTALVHISILAKHVKKKTQETFRCPSKSLLCRLVSADSDQRLGSAHAAYMHNRPRPGGARQPQESGAQQQAQRGQSGRYMQDILQ